MLQRLLKSIKQLILYYLNNEEKTLNSWSLLASNPALRKYKIGKMTYGQPLPRVIEFADNNSALVIGNFCSIAENVTIMLGGEHHTDWITTYPLYLAFRNPKPSVYSKGGVTIGHDVWIGKDALILSGVTIGNGAIIGAGAVVTKNVEPYSIVAGNPAKMIKKRFDQETIDTLETIQWWNWPISKVKENADILQSDDIKALITTEGLLNQTKSPK
jgi:acetyltransferase-like isoleucine patch superfamily enzyme